MMFFLTYCSETWMEGEYMKSLIRGDPYPQCIYENGLKRFTNSSQNHLRLLNTLADGIWNSSLPYGYLSLHSREFHLSLLLDAPAVVSSN